MCLSILPPGSGTLISKWNAKHLLSSENRTLDHWAVVLFFFSLVQVRHSWCLFFRSFLILGVQWLPLFSWRHPCVVSLDTLTPVSTLCEAFSKPWITLTIISCPSHPYCLFAFSYHTSLFHSALHLYACIQHSVATQPFQQWPTVSYPYCRGCWL